MSDKDKVLSKKWKIIIGVVAVLMLGVSLYFYFVPSQGPAFLEQRQAGEDAVSDTLSWESAKEDYEFFRTQKEDIEATRKQLRNYQQQDRQFHNTYGNDSSEWARSTRIRHGRIHDRVVAAQNKHADQVAEYEARANMAHRSIFQCGLPYDMDQKFWLGDGRPDDKYRTETTTAPEEPSECVELTEAAVGAPTE